MKYTLRKYQQEAVRSMHDDFKNHQKSIVSLPTGSGKSLVIADFVNGMNKPAIILQPSREILAQNKEKLSTYVEKSNIGVYSASFNSKEIKKFTFATIQSVYKVPELFSHFGVVIIDEAHLYKLGGMFDKFLRGIRKAKVYGLTATPFKLVQEKKYNFAKQEMHVYGVLRMLTQIGFDDIIYTISTKELTDLGFLAPLEYRTSVESKANFNLNSDKQIMNDFDLVLSLSGLDKIAPILRDLKFYKSTIVFCPSVSTAMRLNSLTTDIESAFVSGETKAKERDQILRDFLSGKIKVIFNCEVLTTGFDHPGLDCIVLARPTKSLNLYNQMLGRGTRIAKDKKNCIIFDITGTSKLLGKLDEIRVVKEMGEWNIKTSKGMVRNKIMSYYKGKMRRKR